MVFILLKRIKNNRPISPEAEENESESDTDQPPNKVKKTDEQGTVLFFIIPIGPYHHLMT